MTKENDKGVTPLTPVAIRAAQNRSIMPVSYNEEGHPDEEELDGEDQDVIEKANARLSPNGAFE